MPPTHTPYVFREEPEGGTDEDDGPVGRDLVIVDGETTWYRRY